MNRTPEGKKEDKILVVCYYWSVSPRERLLRYKTEDRGSRRIAHCAGDPAKYGGTDSEALKNDYDEKLHE